MNARSSIERLSETLINLFARIWPICAGAAMGLVLRLLFDGRAPFHVPAMMSSFIVLVPFAVGAVTTYLSELGQRRTLAEHFFLGAFANLLFVLGTLFTLIEGWICAIVAFPLFALLGGVGSLVMAWICRKTNWPRRAMYSFTVLPLLLGSIEAQLPLPNQLRSIESVQEVKASPASIWHQLTAATDIRPNEINQTWMYKIGVPLPRSAVARIDNGELVRHVEMGKEIQFDQVSRDWMPERYVHFRYRFTEDSFPAGALDEHVRIGGRYFDVIDTDYVIEPTPSGARLHLSMHYRVSTTFNWYAAPIAAFLVRDFEQRVLVFYAHRAELASASN